MSLYDSLYNSLSHYDILYTYIITMSLYGCLYNYIISLRLYDSLYNDYIITMSLYDIHILANFPNLQCHPHFSVASLPIKYPLLPRR